MKGKYKVIPCQSLGTFWRDILAPDGSVFAMQVEAEAAEFFCKNPDLFSKVHHVEILRRDRIEQEWKDDKEALTKIAAKKPKPRR